MGTSKLEYFNEDQIKLAAMAKALAHPARIAILEFLVAQNSCVCGDIVQEIKLAQATVSQHLKELKNAGLIKGTIEGPSTCYCIDVDQWKIVQEKFVGLFKQVNNSSCC